MYTISQCRESSLTQSSSYNIAGTLSQCPVLLCMQGSHDWELRTCRKEPALGVAVWVRAILPQVLGQPLVQSSSDASQLTPNEPLRGRVSSKSHPLPPVLQLTYAFSHPNACLSATASQTDCVLGTGAASWNRNRCLTVFLVTTSCGDRDYEAGCVTPFSFALQSSVLRICGAVQKMKQPAADRALLYLSSLLKAAVPPEQEEEELNYAGLPRWHPGTVAMGTADDPLVSLPSIHTKAQRAVQLLVVCTRQHCQEHEVVQVVPGA